MFGKVKIALAAILLSGFVLQGCDTSPPVSRLETAKAKSESCVEPTDIMKVRHMDFIQHQQDETVYGGLRDTDYEFKSCVNCHVPAEENGLPVNYLTETGVLNEEHFCATCHKYSAVKIDCFECHSDNPQVTDQPMPLDANHTNDQSGQEGGVK